MTARKTCVSLLLDSANIPSRRNPRESAIARSVEDFRNIVLYQGKFFDWVLFFSSLSFAFHPIKVVLTFFSPFEREREGGGGGGRSLSRLLKSQMAAVSHRNSMHRDDQYHLQLGLIKRIIKNNTIYYIKVSGIPSGKKSIKTIWYAHMWRYDKYFTRSLRSLVTYFSTLEDKFLISARPCHILYIFTIPSTRDPSEK